ncbi:leucine-rich repeat-containing protein 28-like [Dreissena polymorpha]|uniref:leucine-rich repeat-containing protein 28-like n=1 Tax=Dreissena polymorpha TaxID=45954 RepID=UPI002265612C|nr:leucine-rich repeat-containing protein 28-like [Dreissena polymorpha]
MSPRNCVVMIGVLIVFLAACVYGFLLDTNLDPCSRDFGFFTGYSINCIAKALHSIPVFNLTGYTNVCFNVLSLSNNYLTVIGNDAFIQLRNPGCSYHIGLNNNSISQIDEYAFRGIEANIIGLYLHKNSLNHLPEAISSIIYLRQLTLYENPLLSLNPSVMAKIGHSLDEFSVGMASFKQWPTELHFLYKLTDLELYDIPFQFLDSSAFRGLTNVTSLAIMGSNFRKIPNAICTLSALSSLQIDNNYLLNESKSDVFEPCSHISGTLHVTRIDYRSNRVDFFPKHFYNVSSCRSHLYGPQRYAVHECR